jgi:CRISPR-associated protein Cas1
MRSLTTLYVTGHRSTVRARDGSLVVHDPPVRTKVPIDSLEAVVILGYGQVTTQALDECTRRGVRVAALTRNGRIRFTVAGPQTGNVHLRVAQYRAATDQLQRTALSRMFVLGKLQNCRRTLMRWRRDARPQARWTLTRGIEHLEERIHNAAAASDPDRLRGIEGDATRRYFQAVRAHLWGTDTTFDLRTRRPPRDPVNALLSFSYALLTTEIVGALESVGLDPQLGLMHSMRPGRPALALDLLEELRPVADRFAVRLFKLGQLDSADFTVAPGGATHLTDDSRKAVLNLYEEFKQADVVHPLLRRAVPRWSLPHTQATLLARHLRGDLPTYPPYVIAD